MGLSGILISVGLVIGVLIPKQCEECEQCNECEECVSQDTTDLSTQETDSPQETDSTDTSTVNRMLQETTREFLEQPWVTNGNLAPVVNYDETGFVFVGTLNADYYVAVQILPINEFAYPSGDIFNAVLTIYTRPISAIDTTPWTLAHTQVVDHAMDLIFSDDMVELKDMTFDGVNDLVIFMYPSANGNSYYGIWQSMLDTTSGRLTVFKYLGEFAYPTLKGDAIRSWVHSGAGSVHSIYYFRWSSGVFGPSEWIEITLNVETYNETETEHDWIISDYKWQNDEWILVSEETLHVDFPDVDSY